MVSFIHIIFYSSSIIMYIAKEEAAYSLYSSSYPNHIHGYRYSSRIRLL